MEANGVIVGEPVLGFCPKCRARVAARYIERDGGIFLRKDCSACGPTEALISTDAGKWHRKRAQCGYEGTPPSGCLLNCTDCNHGKTPTLVFLDVTNRCNMNCPICLANLDAMGFEFDPPMEYFDKVFEHLSKFSPRPKIQLFGGEPTVRNDLIEIIKRARTFGLSARVVTNGLRLADEDYCKKLLATGCQLMFSLDGRHPDIYTRLRKSANTLEKKLKALENVKKHRKSKITIMCCTGVGVNEDHIADLVQYCHENRDFIAALDMIPLTATWGPEAVDAHDTTIDDVERIFANAVPGAEMIPAGMLYKIPTIQETFGLRLTFGGAHPNCESVSMLVSDGKAYRPVSRYLRMPLGDLAQTLAALDRSLAARLPNSIWSRLFGRRGRQVAVGMALLGVARRAVNLREVFGGSPVAGISRLVWGLLRGRKGKDLLRRHTRCQGILRVIVLPFEEPDRVDSARLSQCPAAFAYEHPLTRQIGLMPVCSWSAYKDNILRRITERYGTVRNPIGAERVEVASR